MENFWIYSSWHYFVIICLHFHTFFHLKRKAQNQEPREILKLKYFPKFFHHYFWYTFPACTKVQSWSRFCSNTQLLLPILGGGPNCPPPLTARWVSKPLTPP